MPFANILWIKCEYMSTYHWHMTSAHCTLMWFRYVESDGDTQKINRGPHGLWHVHIWGPLKVEAKVMCFKVSSVDWWCLFFFSRIVVVCFFKLPSSKLTWQWKIPMFNREYIFNFSIFQPVMLVYQRVHGLSKLGVAGFDFHNVAYDSSKWLLLKDNPQKNTSLSEVVVTYWHQVLGKIIYIFSNPAHLQMGKKYVRNILATCINWQLFHAKACYCWQRKACNNEN